MKRNLEITFGTLHKTLFSLIFTKFLSESTFMPYLILYSRMSYDSKILRQTAQFLGWETLRLETSQMPNWFELQDTEYALFYTAPSAFHIARQLSLKLLGCDAYWLSRLPMEYTKRIIKTISLKQAKEIDQSMFIKPSLSKSFQSGVYEKKNLLQKTLNLPDEMLVLISEPVKWTLEYRCFILKRKVLTMSVYRRYDQLYNENLKSPEEEIQEAKSFIDEVLQDNRVESPPGIVIDVGYIENRGWAIVESNQCWASGIYGCEPKKVLESIRGACISMKHLKEEEKRWDFEKHFFAANQKV